MHLRQVEFHTLKGIDKNILIELFSYIMTFEIDSTSKFLGIKWDN